MDGVSAVRTKITLQAGAKQKDVQQQAQAVRLLATLLGSVSAHRGAAQHAEACADGLVPAIPALAQLLVMDLPPSDQAKSKQPMGQPPRASSKQLDRAALQLEAAYLLLFVLDSLSPQVRPCSESFSQLCSGAAFGKQRSLMLSEV